MESIMEEETNSNSVLALLECQICLQPYKAPIYVCHNGHSICNICITKVEHCPTCRHLYTGTRNFLVEKMCESVEGNQSNAGSSRIAEMDSNEFRPIPCWLQQDGCTVGNTDFLYYIQHLRSQHNVEYVVDSTYTKKFIVRGRRVFRGVSSDVFILNFLDLNFVVTAQEKRGQIWFWVGLQGSDAMANNFRVKMALGTAIGFGQISSDQNSIPEITNPFRIWSSRVFSLQSTASEVCADSLMVATSGVHCRLLEASSPKMKGRNLYLTVTLSVIDPGKLSAISVPLPPNFAVPSADGLLSCCRLDPPRSRRVRVRRLTSPTSSFPFSCFRVVSNTMTSIVPNRHDGTAENTGQSRVGNRGFVSFQSPTGSNNFEPGTARIEVSDASSSFLSRLPSSRFGSCIIS